jgi:O-succinylbenzoate synthase
MSFRKIEVKAYRRAFGQPLRSARGEWTHREGFLVRIEESGRVGYGEVAPLPEFGTETLAAASAFLQSFVANPTLEVPGELPCCAFGLSAAATEVSPPARDYAVSALLPAGAAALAVAARKIEFGYRSLKWKIGVEPIEQELAAGRRLLDALPGGVALRLDANASLSLEALQKWLGLLADYRAKVDYLEQPLAVGEESAMALAMDQSGVPIALDESLNGMEGHRWTEPGAWAGPLVIKAPLMSDFEKLLARLVPVADQVVMSSVFETGIGLKNSLRLADALPGLRRPIGFDTLDAFDDSLLPIQNAPKIRTRDRSSYSAEDIWNLI